uniref:Uncharacterized protein n=1 Tax=Avena sativa TaxID=4498 RepID=A0ACD5Y8R0_AVESA
MGSFLPRSTAPLSISYSSFCAEVFSREGSREEGQRRLEKMSSTEASSIPFHMIKTITDDFSEAKKIGSGVYGEVYRQWRRQLSQGLLNGDEVAVKRLFPVNDIDDVVFSNEFSNLMKVQHKNIVRLLHYSYEKLYKHTEHNGQFSFSEVTDRALCFEYMTLGSLSKHISDESCVYDWPTTYKIIKGTCEGLHHLHKGGGEKSCIYHLNLKPDNILLDENLVPKIGDFGLSRLFGDSNTHQTSRTKGTIGFVPSEYINNYKVTPKNDVFSLGVIIFYILTGGKGYGDYSNALRRQNYSTNIDQGFIESVKDYWKKTVGYRWDKTDILGITKCAEIAISCVHAGRDSRPSMVEIIVNLNKLDAQIEKILKNDPKPLPLIRMVQYEKLTLMERSPVVMEAIKEKMSLLDSGKGNRTMEQQNVLEGILEGSMKPTHLPLETLWNITEDFSVDRIIGEGGFGKVYKGVVGNKNVAVKRIRSSMTINQKLFRREVDSQMDVNHENIVRFLVLCSHTVETPMENPEAQGRYIYAEIRERLLCFEFVSNGSLDKYITDELRGLEWGTRYRIIKGICAGLHYLHTEKHILHMDLKPANILLDNQMVPKITDFGLSRPMEISQTMTTHYFSSPGYGAPENLFGRGSMSVKSDMYSLGAIIIEMVTGQKGIPANNNNFKSYVQQNKNFTSSP